LMIICSRADLSGQWVRNQIPSRFLGGAKAGLPLKQHEQ
jgi:hypothetical protein